MSAGTYQNIPRAEIPWYPTINDDLCLNDNVCIDFCSNDVFRIDDISTVVANPYKCVVGCSSCGTQCPSGAITFPDKRELIEVLRSLRFKYSKQGTAESAR